MTTELSDPEAQATVPLWRNRDYLLLLSGQVVSALGSQVSLLALPLLVLALTGSPAQAGLLAGARGVPYALLSLPAGALVDRWDRKRLMILCDLGRALALGSVALALTTGRLTLVQLVLVSLAEGSLSVLFSIAESSALPRLIGREQIARASAQNAAADSLSWMLGPAIGGALFAVGAAVPFAVDALSYAASVVSLRIVRAEFQGERTLAPRGIRGEIREGLAWLWRRPALRFMAMLTGGLNLTGFGFSLILIVLAEHLGADPITIGLIFAGGGTGSVLGALASAELQRRLPAGPLLIGSTWALALTWLFYLLAPNPLVLGLANGLAFFCVPIFFGTQSSYRLTVVPDALQGRLNSVFRLISFGCEPLSLAITGVLLEGVGPAATVILLFLPQLALSIAATANAPLRRLPRIAEATL
jgi:predicted MFS family arabinose efflux permease